MPWGMTAGAITESEKSSGAKEIVFVKMELDSGDVRLWNGKGSIDFNSETYTGLGDFGQISEIVSSIDTRPFSISFEVSGIIGTNDMIAEAEAEDIIGRAITIWVGYLDDNYDIVADPTIEFRGRLDTMPIILGETLTVGITAESRLADWYRSKIRRFTDGDQKQEFPSDKGYEFSIVGLSREIIWGGVKAGGESGGAISTSNTSTDTQLAAASWARYQYIQNYVR